jgi:hypothetical protein
VKHFRPWVSDCLGRWYLARKEGDEFFRSASNSSGKWVWKILDKKKVDNVNDETSSSNEESISVDSEDDDDDYESTDRESADGAKLRAPEMTVYWKVIDINR